jgi:hypothetical protein
MDGENVPEWLGSVVVQNIPMPGRGMVSIITAPHPYPGISGYTRLEVEESGAPMCGALFDSGDGRRICPLEDGHIPRSHWMAHEELAQRFTLRIVAVLEDTGEEMPT